MTLPQSPNQMNRYTQNAFHCSPIHRARGGSEDMQGRSTCQWQTRRQTGDLWIRKVDCIEHTMKGTQLFICTPTDSYTHPLLPPERIWWYGTIIINKYFEKIKEKGKRNASWSSHHHGFVIGKALALPSTSKKRRPAFRVVISHYQR